MISRKQKGLQRNLDKLLTEYELTPEDINALFYIQGAILSRVLCHPKKEKQQ
jgi:hypothetical protein